MNTTNDSRLIRAAQRGDLEAFHQLVQGFDRPVLHLALRITRTEPPARSIYYETMLRLHSNIAALESAVSWRLCAYRILVNLCLEYLRAERASVPTVLSPRERIVFELMHWQGLDLRTVGKVLDTTEEITRNTLVRAVHKLSAAPVGHAALNKTKGKHAEDSSHR